MNEFKYLPATYSPTPNFKVVRFVNEDKKKIQPRDKKGVYDIYLSTESSN